jgi:hypothetical protein
VRSRDLQEAVKDLAFPAAFCQLSCCRHIFVPIAKLDDLGSRRQSSIWLG